MNDFYVYGHFKPGEDTPFYIGKGRGRRAWRYKRRTGYWKQIANDGGYEVKLLKENLTEKDAYRLEKELIAEIGLDNLTNVFEGGHGMPTNYAKLIAQKNAQNPEWRKNVAEANRKRAMSPEYQKNHKKAMKRVYKTTEWKESVTEANRKLAQDPEWRDKQKEGIRKKYEDPEYRKKRAEGIKRYWANKKKNK